MNFDDSLPDALLDLLDQKLACRDPKTNLLGYGSLPQVAAQQKALLQIASR
jgi:hypothetical protein